MSTTLSDLPYGKVQTASFKLIQALGSNGALEATVDRINSEPAFVERIAKSVLTGGYEPTTGHVRARQIMGSNMFGPEDVIKHFGVQVTRRQLAALAEIPFSEETLVVCRNTHVLVAVPTASILNIQRAVKVKFPAGQKSLFYKQDWCNKEAFAKEKEQVGWYLVRKIPVENSTGKTWDEQQALLDKDEETPSARVMVYMTIAYFLATGEHLFKGIFVRCSDLDSRGRRVCVGFFDADGLSVYHCWDNGRHDRFGVSSAWK